MSLRTDDFRIRAAKILEAPDQLCLEFPVSEPIAHLVLETRKAIHDILSGVDSRLLVVIGPCSIHDPVSALEYATRLKSERDKHASTLLVVMRVYFEKPRTALGWKGLINDPYLDNSCQIEDGLRIGRRLLLDLNRLGLPTGVEFLDVISPQYLADLVSWGAIGARTCESQVHRELASGLSCPVGFKNRPDGDVKVAIDAIKAARHSHRFLSVTKNGRCAIVATSGNEDCHVILRGGRQPNCDAASVNEACQGLAAAGLPDRVMVDLSHSNSQKDHLKQIENAHDLAARIAAGDSRALGVMVESHLKGGRQDLQTGRELVYGQSITDACIGWEESVVVLDALADAMAKRPVRSMRAALS